MLKLNKNALMCACACSSMFKMLPIIEKIHKVTWKVNERVGKGLLLSIVFPIKYDFHGLLLFGSSM